MTNSNNQLSKEIRFDWNKELQKTAITSINSHKGIYTNDIQKNDSWEWKVGKQQESLDWLIK